MGRRSLKNQLQHAVCISKRLGISKKAERESGVNTEMFCYSRNTVKKMFALVNTFSDWMRDKHPELKWAKNLDSKYFIEYGQDKRKDWTDQTAREMSHRVHKLGLMINNAYGLDLDFSDVYFASGDKKSPNKQAYTREDCDKVRELLLSKETGARFLVDISYRIGARSEEARSITSENIKIDKRVVELRNCKNGRDRDVPIREKDIEFFRNLKQYMENNNWTNACNGITENACNKAVRGVLRELGISEKYDGLFHPARKLYAKERMKEEQDNGKSWVKSWETVQGELGHGEKYRGELVHAYLGI